MIQNISQNRTDKRITQQDLKRIFVIATQTLYPGTSLFFQGKGFQLIHVPVCVLYYVKGISNGKASSVWRASVESNFEVTNPSKVPCNISTTDNSRHIVRFKTNAVPSDIYPTLKINEGETKIIVQPYIYADIINYKDVNGKNWSSIKELFKLFLVPPRHFFVNGISYYAFHSVSIFTPKPGLFDETPPQ